MLKTLATLKIRDHFSPIKPASCDSSASVNEALDIMVGKKIGSLIITEGIKIVGILTERDYFLKVAGKDFDGHSQVTTVMTPGPMLINADRTADYLFKYLQYNRFHYVIVVEKDLTPYTIVSMRELIKLVCSIDLATGQTKATA